MKKLLLSLALAALGHSAAAQPVLLVPAPPAEPTLTSSTVLFDCKDHFAGKGRGACTQILEVDFRNAPETARNGQVTCNVSWAYRKQSSPSSQQLRDLVASGPMPLQNGWGLTRLTLSSDFGSVADETLAVHVANVRCRISYS